MIRILVRYTVKSETLESVQNEIVEFMKAIRENEPETVYEVYNTDDEYTFVHLIVFTSHKAREFHKSAHYTERFTDFIYARCEDEPEFLDLTLFESSQ